MRILVIGATGGTGQAIVRNAQANGHEVTALVRSIDTAKTLLSGATLIEGDARAPYAVESAVEGCDGVISSLGPKLSLFREVTVLSDATRVLIEAMRAHNVERLVCITGMGAGDSRGHGGFIYDRLIQPILLREIYKDKDRQEAVIKASGLDWTIVRPTVLTDDPATSKVRALTDLQGFHGGKIARSDVADFVVTEIENPKWTWKTPLITS